MKKNVATKKVQLTEAEKCRRSRAKFLIHAARAYKRYECIDEPLTLEVIWKMQATIRTDLVKHGATTNDLVSYLADQFKLQREHKTLLADLVELTGLEMTAIEMQQANAFGFDMIVSPDGWSYTLVKQTIQ